jgi:predicted nucleotide-binding protein
MTHADEVLRRLEAAGLALEDRRRLPNGTGEQLRFTTGEVVCVFDTGTVNAQGKNQDRIREILALVERGAPATGAGRSAGRNVFVVYGHDNEARTQLEAMLRRWQLEPLILDQLPSEGQTIIEKLERYSSDDVRFAVVLATRDDVGYPRDSRGEEKLRARQNMVLELGLMLAKLGRPRVAILLRHQDQMERPSDIQGLIYLPFRDTVEEVKLQLAKEMDTQHLSIDLARL